MMLEKLPIVYNLLSFEVKRMLVFATILSLFVAILDVFSIYIMYCVTQILAGAGLSGILEEWSRDDLFWLVALFFVIHGISKLVLTYQSQKSAYLSGWCLSRLGFESLINSSFKKTVDFESATTSLIHRSAGIVQLVIFPLLNVVGSFLSIIIIMSYLISLSLFTIN